MAAISSSCKKEIVKSTDSCTYTSLFSAHPKKNDFDKVLNNYVTRGLPGIIVLVRDSNGTYIGSAGMADIEKGISIQPCHVSKVASITKLMLSTTIMQLSKQGILNLDEPISYFLPTDLNEKVANVKNVSLRQLLNHTSGIPDVVADQGFYLSLLDNPQKCWEASELIRFVYNDDAVFEVGKGIKYSNSNFLLASMIVESKTQQSHSELIHKYIIDPLGMDNTYYQCHDALPANVAQGYYDLYNSGNILNLTNYNTGSGNGYGGMFSTVFDLQLFIEALLREKTLLDSSSLAEMLTFTDEEPNMHRAMGLGIFKDFLERSSDEYAYGHRGRDLAYSADAFYFPNQDVTMCFIVNYGTNGETALKKVFLDFRSALVDVIMN